MRKIIIAALASLSSLAVAQGLFGFKPGEASAPITGSASNQGATNEAPALEKCEKPLGTLAVSEPQDFVAVALTRYGLPPPTQLLRLMIQQSNCFQVVERGIAMQNILQERALSASGNLQSGQNIGKGQLVAADFLMTANITFTENNSGGAGLGAIGGMFGVFGAVIGAVAAGMKFKQAQTSLIVADARSGLQVAAAEGNVEKADWAIGAAIGGVGGGAYTNTAEGKVVAAALLINYNNIVQSVRNLPSLIQAKPSDQSSQNAAASVKAGAFNAGDILVPKINGINLFDTSDKNKPSKRKLQRNDELIYLGSEDNGMVKVQTSDGEGWLELILVRKQ
jgi:hypothetical protein